MSLNTNELELSLLTPNRTLVKNEPIKSLTVVTAEGEIQVLPQHQNYISILMPGVFKVEKKTNEPPLLGVISSGTIEVQDGHITITAENLELKDEINVNRAKDAEKNARAQLSGAVDSLTEDSFNKHQLKLQRALIRQQISKIR